MEGEVVYLSGAYLPKQAAGFSVEDRGMLFGDGVYEVVAYYGGRGFAVSAHGQRLRQSLRGIRIPEPAEVARLGEITDELLRRNGWRDAKVYWQVTRGAAVRELAFPRDVPPAVLVMAYPLPPLDTATPVRTLRAMLADDVRWRQCSIKSLMLLPNLLAHNAALAAGADAAIFRQDGGIITEGANTNAFAVRDGELWTHPLNGRILGGITRDVVLQLARERGIAVREEPFTANDLHAADEAFLTSTTTHVQAVTQVDGQAIGDGRVGPVTQRLHDALLGRIARACGV